MAFERREYEGGAVVTSLSAGINDTVTTFSIADTTNWPDGSVGPFFLVIDEGTASEEKVKCLSRSGTTITVDPAGRGADDTTAVTHAATAEVKHVFVAVDADEANQAVVNTIGRISAVGDLLVGNGANTLKRLARGSANQYVRVNAAGTDLEYADFVSSPEDDYWRDRAALLDPAAYEHIQGTGWTQTVPVGQTWYALNLWHVEVGSAYKFLRVADASRPLMLPAGTVLTADAVQQGFAYLCKPSLVTGDDRYDTPRDLYYERIDRLRTLALHDLAATVSAGTSPGVLSSASFPNDFDAGLITLVSVHDVGWVILNGPTSLSMNLLNEISDEHQLRIAEAVMVPFNRDTTFDEIQVTPASVLGNGGTSVEGYGVVSYHKLPVDW